MTVCKYILIFFFYSAAGWLGESLYRSIGERRIINSGFLTGPMCPIYGTGAMVLTAFIYPFRQNIFICFFLGLLLCDIVEYITSFLMEKLFHARWWDYSQEFLNINGRICFKHTCYWGIASVAFSKLIHPLTEKIFSHIPEKMYVYIAAAVLAVFIADVIRSVKNALDIVKLEQKIQKLVQTVEQVPSVVAQSIEELESELKFGIGKTSDKIADKSHDAYVQILDFITELEKLFTVKKGEKRQLKFRQVLNNPGFRKSVTGRIEKIRAGLEEIVNNISNR